MLRIILFLASLFIAGFLIVQGAWNITIIAFGYEITVSLIVAILALLCILYVVHVIKQPFLYIIGLKNWHKTTRQHKKMAYITAVLIAALDKDNAKIPALLKQKHAFFSPNSTIPDLITALLAPSNKSFDALTNNAATQLAGMRGLYLKAIEKGNIQYATHILSEMHEKNPKTYWIMHELLSLYLMDNDYESALKMVEKLKSAKQLSKKEYATYLANLSFKMGHIAKAYYLEKSNPAYALAYAKEKPHKTTAILRDLWQTNPTFEALSYYRTFIADLPNAKQIKAIEKLISKNPEHRLSLYAKADIYLHAKLFNQAKETLEIYFNTYSITEKTALLMAQTIRTGWHHEEEASQWDQKALALADKNNA